MHHNKQKRDEEVIQDDRMISFQLFIACGWDLVNPQAVLHAVEGGELAQAIHEAIYRVHVGLHPHAFEQRLVLPRAGILACNGSILLPCIV